MRHRNHTKRLNRQKDHLHLMMRNLATSLLLYEKIKTTEAKAKAVTPIVEHLIARTRTLSDLHAYRALNAYLLDKNASQKMVRELKARYKDRSSGFVTIVPLGARRGDAAPLVQVALV